MSAPFTGIARFTFHEGKVEEFKRLSLQCMEIVESQDTGTLRYDCYLNADETEAIVIEEYVSIAALKEHTEHIGEEIMNAVIQTGTVYGEILGDISDDDRALFEGGPVQPFWFFMSKG